MTTHSDARETPMTTTTDPHPTPDESPEQHIGIQIPDPWADPAQTDWPDLEVNIDDMDRGTES